MFKDSNQYISCLTQLVCAKAKDFLDLCICLHDTLRIFCMYVFDIVHRNISYMDHFLHFKLCKHLELKRMIPLYINGNTFINNALQYSVSIIKYWINFKAWKWLVIIINKRFPMYWVVETELYSYHVRENWTAIHFVISSGQLSDLGQSTVLFLSHCFWHTHVNFSFITSEGLIHFLPHRPLRSSFGPLSFWVWTTESPGSSSSEHHLTTWSSLCHRVFYYKPITSSPTTRHTSAILEA